MAMTLFPPPLVQFEDDSGNLLSGGKVYFYEPGTSTLKDTYTDQAGGTANANPVILDSRGEAAIWLNGFYKVNVTESDDTQVTGYPIDNVSSGSAATSTTQTEWTSPGDTPTYISATQFSVPGDQSTVYQVNRRIKVTVGASTYYGVITVVAYTTLTTVTISLDSGSLTSSLSIVDVGLLTVTNPSIHEGVRKVADATALTHAVNAGQVQDNKVIYIGDSGAADVYVMTLGIALTAYLRGQVFFMDGGAANATTTPTVEINGLGALTIKRITGAALLVGDMPAGHKCIFFNDGTDIILLNPALHDHTSSNQGGLLGQIQGRCSFDGSAGTPAELDALNITSITDNGAGDYTVTWDVNFSTNDYAVAVIALRVGGANMDIGITAIAVGTVQFVCETQAGTPTDSGYVSIMASGTQ